MYSTKRRWIFTLAMVLLIISQISYQRIQQINTSREKRNLVENFDDFYNRFHSDSVFQMSRVRFPLEGGIWDAGQDLNWTKENYRLLRTKIFDVDTTTFKVSFSKTDSSFIQKVWLEDSGYWSEYKFSLINKKWYLVYAVDSND